MMYCGSFLDFSILYMLTLIATAEYPPNGKYSGDFYYEIGDTCPREDVPFDVVYVPSYRAFPPYFDPLTRILSVARDKGQAFVLERVDSDELETFIIKGKPYSVIINAPNLKSFTLVDTTELVWNRTFWRFPKLRVLNLVSIRLYGFTYISSMGSKDIEILRIRGVEYTHLELENIEDFTKLRVLELTQQGFSTFGQLCPLLDKLNFLEHLTLVGFSDGCLVGSLKRFATGKVLKSIRLHQSGLTIPDGELCLLFPPDIKTLRVDWKKGITDTREFECYKQLKIAEFGVPLGELQTISDNIPAVSVYSDKSSPQCNMSIFTNLTNIRILRIWRLYDKCTHLPEAENAEIIHFNDNGFRFTEGVMGIPYYGKLRIMDLSKNPIGYIPYGAFEKLPQLRILVLQHTSLTGFVDVAFCNLVWPKILTFDQWLPENTAFTMPEEEKGKVDHNSLSCLVNSTEASHIYYINPRCHCWQKKYNYLPKRITPLHFGMDKASCVNDFDEDEPYEYFENKCPYGPLLAGFPEIKRYEPQCPEVKDTTILVIWWLILILISWLPPCFFFIRYTKGHDGNILEDQRKGERKTLFIICPRHARKWSKKVLVPCFEADLFANSRPRLRHVRMDSVRQTSAEHQVNQHGSQSVASGELNKPPSSVPQSRAIISPKSSDTVSLEAAPKKGSKESPHGPWAWQPLYTCHLPPPARHRLEVLMESCHVVIVLASSSLFTEPACRAQLRLAFHLTRLHRIPPPTIIVWPTTRFKARVATDYRTKNRMRHRADHNKYYPAVDFDSVTNDPDDIAETATIKAKVPTREEAIHIVKYFSTLPSPCVQWSNSKTVAQNLGKLVWLHNKVSRIPAY